MDHTSIAFAIITYYPKWYRGKLQSLKHTDKVRGDLALEFFTTALKQNYRVVVVDGKSTRSFIREIGKIPEIIIIKRKSLSRSISKRMAFRTASKLPNVKVIVATEAEKVSLLKNCIELMTGPILSDKADIVIPRRNEKLFKSSYPLFQYESEKEGNQLYNEQLRAAGLLSNREDDLDIFFGPRAFLNDRKIVSLFMKQMHLKYGKHRLATEKYFNPDDLSVAGFFPIALALKKGFRVKSVEVPFTYPLTQKRNEGEAQKSFFIEKRRWQKTSILIDLMYFLNGYFRKR